MFNFLNGSLLRRAGLAMGIITVLAVIGMTSAVLVARSTQGDASAVNIAGSLRMQSYRIIAALEAGPVQVDNSISYFATRINNLTQEFNVRLHNPSLATVINESYHNSLQASYAKIQNDWRNTVLIQINNHMTQTKTMIDEATYIVPDQIFRQLIDDFVINIDLLVKQLELSSNSKIHVLGLTQGLNLMLVLVVAAVTLYFIHTDVLNPLNELLKSSEKAGSGDFSGQISRVGDDELGRLGQAFNTMNYDLSRMYTGLEKSVAEKTRELTLRNRSLELLYNATQKLTEVSSSNDIYQDLITQMAEVTDCDGLTLCLSNDSKKGSFILANSGNLPPNCDGSQCTRRITDSENFAAKQFPGKTNISSIPVGDERGNYGVLLLMLDQQQQQPEPWKIQLLTTLGKHIGLAIGAKYRDRERRRLALFEERSAIARELHDSLAQSLSYLKIQVTRLSSLRKSGAGDDKIEDVEANLSEGLNLAYQELRKLLKTFRLQMDERGLALTLAEEITEINARSGINIQLNYQFNTSPFTVSEEIHVLYIVREALANVEKHSGAKHAMVRVCSSKDESIRVSIEDDGGGFKLPETEMGHYGMTIMQERAHSLNGTLEVGATSTGGICVDLTFFPKKISTRKDTIQEI